MANNPTYGFDEGYHKKTSCFIDASNLGDEFERLVVEHGSLQECSISVVNSSSPGLTALNAPNTNEQLDSTIDSLEHSEKHSPNLPEISKSVESLNQSFPVSWFVDISHDNSIEGSPRLLDDKSNNDRKTENMRKKNIFDMFVDLRDPKDKNESDSVANASKVAAHQKRLSKKSATQVTPTVTDFVKRRPASVSSTDTVLHELETICEKDPCNDSKESGFVSDLPDEKPKLQMQDDLDSPPSKTLSLNDKLDTPKYPSLNSYSCYFVKLSDLDKVPKVKLEPVKENVPYEIRMVKSIPERNLTKQVAYRFSRSTGYLPIYSENTKSLNRIFPNLLSAPGTTLLTPRSSTPSEMDELPSESESSMQSIACGSITEMSGKFIGQIGHSYESRLGEDLLRIFEKEIVTDVTVQFAGRRLRAHKCVLAARCPHFAALMSGGLVESAGNIIHIEGFSYSTVYFTLRYIYSGTSILPDSIDLFELTTLADKLGLEGLKEVIAGIIKDKYCHNFHKPCGLCTLGVLECLPMSMEFGLEEIYQKSLVWLTEHFIEIWPTKAFGTMPIEALEKVCDKQRVNMTPENVVNLVYGCRQIGKSLPNTRWAESVRRTSGSILKSSENFAASHLSDVLRSLISAPTASVHLTETILTDWINKAITFAPIKEVCKAYELLSNHCISIHTRKCSQGELGVVEHWRRMCEDTLVTVPAHISFESGLRALPQELKSRLEERGCIVELSVSSYPALRAEVARKHAADKMSRTTPTYAPNTSQRLEIARMYKAFIPYLPKPAASCKVIRAEPRYDTSLQKLNVNPPVIRTTRAQKKRQEYNKTTRHSYVEANYREVRAKRAQSVTMAVTSRAKATQVDSKALLRPPAEGRNASSSESSRKSSPILSQNRARTRHTSSLANVQPNLQRKSSSHTSVLTCSKGGKEVNVDRLNGSTQNNVAKNFTANNKEKRSDTNCTMSHEPKPKSSGGTANTGGGEINGAVSKWSSKSRIPVYMGGRKKGAASMPSLWECSVGRAARAAGKRLPGAGGPERPPGGRLTSLMSPTTSSAAKAVPKRASKSNAARSSSGESSVSTLQRSSTFVKEEPCFPGSPDISKA